LGKKRLHGVIKTSKRSDGEALLTKKKVAHEIGKKKKKRKNTKAKRKREWDQGQDVAQTNKKKSKHERHKSPGRFKKKGVFVLENKKTFIGTG